MPSDNVPQGIAQLVSLAAEASAWARESGDSERALRSVHELTAAACLAELTELEEACRNLASALQRDEAGHELGTLVDLMVAAFEATSEGPSNDSAPDPDLSAFAHVLDISDESTLLDEIAADIPERDHSVENEDGEKLIDVSDESELGAAIDALNDLLRSEGLGGIASDGASDGHEDIEPEPEAEPELVSNDAAPVEEPAQRAPEPPPLDPADFLSALNGAMNAAGIEADAAVVEYPDASPADPEPGAPEPGAGAASAEGDTATIESAPDPAPVSDPGEAEPVIDEATVPPASEEPGSSGEAASGDGVGAVPLSLPQSKLDLVLFMVTDLNGCIERMHPLCEELTNISSRDEAAALLSSVVAECAKACEFFKFVALSDILSLLGETADRIGGTPESSLSELVLRVRALLLLLEKSASGFTAKVELLWPLGTLRDRVRGLLSGRTLKHALVAWHHADPERGLALAGGTDRVRRGTDRTRRGPDHTRPVH